MSPKRCFVVVGYNNARLFGVAKIRQYCATHFGACLVLVIERIQPGDRDTADHLLDCSFESADLEASLGSVRHYLGKHDLQVEGVLPFSDRGVLLGTALARALGLPGGDTTRAQAGLDKATFRALEHACTRHPLGYVPVQCTGVNGLAEFIAAVAVRGGRAFVKPAREGNSRGCMAVHQLDQCAAAWEALQPYRAGGVIVETLIDAAAEFSVDRVAGSGWITEKTTSLDVYRSEIQQIVPATLNDQDRSALEAAGRHICELVSPQNGAHHNEVFLLRNGGTAAVETNMRPAGMRIWDLAALAFENFDPWLEWIRWSSTGWMEPRPLRARCHAGIRQLRAPRDGRLVARPAISELAREFGLALADGAYCAPLGSTVSATVTDNAAFVGHVVLTHRDPEQLKQDLRRLTDAIESGLVVESEDEALASLS
jgi:hypothetical protein